MNQETQKRQGCRNGKPVEVLSEGELELIRVEKIIIERVHLLYRAFVDAGEQVRCIGANEFYTPGVGWRPTCAWGLSLRDVAIVVRDGCTPTDALRIDVINLRILVGGQERQADFLRKELLPQPTEQENG